MPNAAKNHPPKKTIKHLPVATGGMSRLAYKHALAAGINLEAQLQISAIGPVAFLQKPFRANDLIDAINKAIQ